MRFKLASAVLLVGVLGFSSQAALADDTLLSKFLVSENASHVGYDAQSSIEITSPPVVYCSGACSLTVNARFTDSNPWSSPYVTLITSGGTTLASAYLSTSGRTNWQPLTFSFSATSNLDVTFHIADTAAYKMYSGLRKLTRIQAGQTPPSKDPDLTWPTGTTTGTNLNSTFGNGLFRFLDTYVPDRLTTSATCANIPVWFQPRDISTGLPKTDSTALSVSVDYEINGTRVASQSFTDASWSKGVPTLVTNQVCGLNNKLGVSNDVNVIVQATYSGQYVSQLNQASVQVLGETNFTSINCLKGKYIKSVSAERPVCPAGWAKTTITPVNGMLPPTTISCVKGFTLKRVTGVLPSCPAGYRRK
jgi:hypothetical protein